MQMKVPNCSGNSYVGGGDNYEGDTSSDYDEVLEFSSEGEANDFSDFLWMEDEDVSSPIHEPLMHLNASPTFRLSRAKSSQF